MNNRYFAAIMIAGIALMGLSFGGILADDSAADDLPVHVAHSYKMKFISTATDAEHIKWDFGDGTVLDSRDSADPDYAALLAAHGGNVWAPEHQYEVGVHKDYTVTQTVYNSFEGGSEDSTSQICRMVGPPVVTFANTSMTSVAVPYADFLPQVMTQPEAPVKTGHTFGGWFSDEELTEAFDWTQPISDSVTVYAKWTAAAGGDEPGDDDGDAVAPVIEINGTIAVMFAGAVILALLAAVTRRPVVILLVIALAALAAAGALGYLSIPEIITGFPGASL